MDATAWIAAASAVVAVVALYFTGQQVRQVRRQTELQQRMHEDAAQPYVWVDIRPSDKEGRLILLLIRNEGPTVARDVTVTLDPPPVARFGPQPGARGRYDLASMPPGREVRWYLNTGPDWFDSDDPRRFEVTVDSTGPHGRVATGRYVLDFDDFKETAVQPPGTLDGVTKAIEKVAKELKRDST